MSTLTAYVFLGFAITFEVIATSALKSSDGLTRFAPSVLVVAGYGAAFILMAWALKVLPVSLVYAIWAGLGIVGVAMIGTWWFGEVMSAPKIAGIALIVAGVMLLKLAPA